MGTNFYWTRSHRIESKDDLEPFGGREPQNDSVWQHIGKRSAAGDYCWDCDRTLVQGGPAHIHGVGCIGCRAGGGFMFHHRRECPCLMLDVCPLCHKPRQEPGLSSGSAAVELGLAKAPMRRPVGVVTAASFTFIQVSVWVVRRCLAMSEEPCIEDEYGRTLTGLEFLRMLEANVPVPLRFTHSIGRDFS